MNPLDLLDGYKVYGVGLLTVGLGVYKFYHGDGVGAANSILLGLGMLFGRHTLQKLETQVKQ